MLAVALRHDGLRLMIEGEVSKVPSNITYGDDRAKGSRRARRLSHLAEIPRLHVELPQLLSQRFEPIHDNMNHR
jgi:hypothetical protein